MHTGAFIYHAVARQRRTGHTALYIWAPLSLLPTLTRCSALISQYSLALLALSAAPCLPRACPIAPDTCAPLSLLPTLTHHSPPNPQFVWALSALLLFGAALAA